MSANMGPVTITCPGCGERLPVPSRVVVDLPHLPTVLVRMDTSAAREHFRACQASTPSAPATPSTEVEQAHKARPVPPFIAKGHRYCLGCGTTVRECLAQLQRTQAGCCGMCTEGNSHPAPGETKACAEWAAEQPRAQH